MTAMEYMSFLRNGAPAAGNYTMPQFHGALPQGPPHGAPHGTPQGHQGYPYAYTNDPMYMMAHMEHQRAMMDHESMTQSKPNEPKPRLSKEEVELLEREFTKNSKPSSGRKREIADLLKVDHPRINNWFQNRRAKEKQIKKTREFEAQQAADRATSDSNSSEEQEDGAVSEYYGSSDNSQSLQASTASFPDSVGDSQDLNLFLSEQHEPLAVNGLADVQHLSPSETELESLVPDEYPSPKSVPFASVEPSNIGFPTLTSAFVPSQPTENFEPLVSSPVGSLDNQSSHSHLADFASPPQTATMDAFVHFTNAMTDSIVAPVPTFPSQLLIADAIAHTELKMEDALNHDQSIGCGLTLEIPTALTPADSPDLRFKSPPPPANIASRRNKGVPAQLNATALRSYSYGPKTGIDMTKRNDAASPMRRVASATGFLPGRIHKPSFGAAPRSPLHLERTKDAIMRSLQGTRSPILASLNTALSPATSSDIYVQQGTREMTVSSSASDDEQQYTFGAPQGAFFRFDSTLKTPPGTPGLGRGFPEQLVAINTPWNYNPQDEPLITPGLGSFGSEEFSMAPAAPGYVAHSQPPTPSFVPGVGPNYFAWGPAPAEYTFPGEAYALAVDTSAKSSPDQPKSKQFQFTQNVTPQDFGLEKS